MIRVLFLGNGPFAAPILDRVVASPHPVLAVVARPDRPQGKDRRVVPGPVRRRAESLHLPLLQPEDVNAPDAIESLRRFAADVLVVADFGQILSRSCLSATPLGGINVHASLLPKYRGAAPVAWAIFHGETDTGVSILRMTSALDAGDVLAQASYPIDPNVSAGELEAALSPVGAALTIEVLDQLDARTERAVPQSSERATKAPKLKKEDGAIDWSRSAKGVHDQVRAMRPWPLAFTQLHSPHRPPLRLQVLETRVIDATVPSAQLAGTIDRVEADQIIAWAGTGRVALTRVHPAGKRAMSVHDFLRGYRVAPGDRFQ